MTVRPYYWGSFGGYILATRRIVSSVPRSVTLGLKVIVWSYGAMANAGVAQPRATQMGPSRVQYDSMTRSVQVGEQIAA